MKIKKSKIISLLIIILIVAGLTFFFFSDRGITPEYSGKIKLPLFTDYPVAKTKNTTFPKIDLQTNPDGLRYKTRIEDVNGMPPNFAGKYSIVVWGCGASCQTGFIIDRESGRIIESLPFLMQNGFDIRLDSNLFIVNPYTSDDADYQEEYPTVTYYMQWNGKSFEEVGAYLIKKDSVTASTSTPPKQL